jgi:uncharacterized protein involved in response to NO
MAALLLLWVAGRFGMLFSGDIGALTAAAADLSFPVVFLAVVAREIFAGRNWRNLPMLFALSLLLAGNLLLHLEALGIAETASPSAGGRLFRAVCMMEIGAFGRDVGDGKCPQVRLWAQVCGSSGGIGRGRRS